MQKMNESNLKTIDIYRSPIVKMLIILLFTVLFLANSSTISTASSPSYKKVTDDNDVKIGKYVYGTNDGNLFRAQPGVSMFDEIISYGDGKTYANGDYWTNGKYIYSERTSSVMITTGKDNY